MSGNVCYHSVQNSLSFSLLSKNRDYDILCGASTPFRFMASAYGASRSHSDTLHSVGLLWTSVQPDAGRYLTTHNAHNRQTSISPAGFEPAFPAVVPPLGSVVVYTHNYNFPDCLVWVWNSVAHMREERRLRVFDNRVLRRIFGPKRDEVTGEWRKLHSEELNDLYCWPNNFRVIKSRRVGWAGHVACMVGRRGACSVLVWNLREGDHLEEQGVDGKIILKWIFKK